jgi:hypothetical protein
VHRVSCGGLHKRGRLVLTVVVVHAFFYMYVTSLCALFHLSSFIARLPSLLLSLFTDLLSLPLLSSRFSLLSSLFSLSLIIAGPSGASSPR